MSETYEYDTDAIIDAWIRILLSDDIENDFLNREEMRNAETMPAPAVYP